MTMKMKGLLKGLRYISTIFDEEHEAEMQIGFPTDVKHVAHIGWDGPTANSPSWINQFKDGEGGGGGGGGEGASNVDQQKAAPRKREQQDTIQEKRLPSGLDSTLESSSRRKSDKTKSSRRATSASDSPRRSSTSSESRSKLQQRQQEQPQQQQVLPAAEGESASAGPKTSSRRKKTKSGPSGAQSSRVSNKSKPTAAPIEFSHYSDPGSASSTNAAAGVGADQTTRCRSEGKDSWQSSVLKASSEQEDQKARDDISRGIRAL